MLPKNLGSILISQIFRLALGELGSTTSGLQTVLLTLLHAAVTSQEAGLLQSGTELGIGLNQSTSQTETDGACLAGEATAGNLNFDVELLSQAQQLNGLTDDKLQGLQTKVVVQSTVVDGNDAGAAGNQTNTSNRALSSAGTVEISLLMCINSGSSPYLTLISGI